jgi:hypothetical protein
MESRLRWAGRLLFIVGVALSIAGNMLTTRKTEMMRASTAEWSQAYDQQTRLSGKEKDPEAAAEAQRRLTAVYAERASDLDTYYIRQSWLLLAATAVLAITGLWMSRPGRRRPGGPPHTTQLAAAGVAGID